MTETDVLRRLLDERDVEYMKVDFLDGFLDGEHITSFDVNGREYGYHEFPDGETLLRVWHLTPEQAITATLGTGTCHNVNHGHTFVCSECGANIDATSSIGYSYVDEFGKRWYGVSNDYGLNYCPNCGRKVVNT